MVLVRCGVCGAEVRGGLPSCPKCGARANRPPQGIQIQFRWWHVPLVLVGSALVAWLVMGPLPGSGSHRSRARSFQRGANDEYSGMACVIAAGQALGTGDVAGHRAARAAADRCLRTVGKKDLVEFCGPLLTGKTNPNDPQGLGTVQVGSNVYSEMRAACAAQPDAASIRRWATAW